MARALITTPFPSTAEVARKLGLGESRIRRVAGLMSVEPTGSNEAASGPRPASTRGRFKGAKPNRAIRKKR
jgi:hypothetical protein